MIRFLTRSGATLAALPLLLGSASAADWPQYRGPARDGRSAETGIVDGWDAEGPRELWRVPVGPGYSGMSVVDGRVYTMDSDAEREYVVALDAGSGATAWRTAIGGLFRNDFGDGPRSTPTHHDSALYTVGSLGELTALDAADGSVRWRRNLQQDFGAELPNWAFTSSPLVVGDAVIVEIGGSRGRTVGGFDRRTGELLWSGGDGAISYSSPIVVPFNGVTQIVFLTQNGLLALSTAGETLWTSEFVPDLGIKPAPPVFVAPDLVFASASYDAGAKVVRMVPAGDSVAIEEVWQHGLMRNHFNGSVAVDGHLCGFDKAFLKCIDAATGEQSWIKRGLGKGSLIVADGKLIVLSERGRLVLLEANAERAVELAAHQALSGRCWTQPALSDGRLYLRNTTEMVAYDLAVGGGPRSAR